ncbi:MAG TPA: thioredoxin domain-containing protein [Polyangiaceae bacterium]|nr:thioredoxin domain-containing protein [Polyangiaceae bacterium]
MTTRTGKVRGALEALSWLWVAVVLSFVGCGGARVPATEPVASIALPTSPPPAPAPPPISASAESATVPVSALDPQWGAQDAPVTIVMFEDLQCPFCSRVQATLAQIRDTYGPRKVRLVWKNNPLPFHQNARLAAEAAMALFGLKGSAAFWQFQDRAFANQNALNDDSFNEWAVDAGVDPVAFKDALSTKKYSSKIDQDIALAAKVGANGTPGFRINGVTVSGAQPFDKFKEVIDAQLAEAAQAVASGTPAADVYAKLTNQHQSAVTPLAPAKPPEEEDKSVWNIPVLDDDPVRGPKDALVTIVEFSDFQCPFCKRVEATLKDIADSYGKDVRFVWKDNPLPFHPRAKPAASLARFAYKQKGSSAFWDVHDQLFASNPKLEDEDLKRIAEKVGVSWSAAKAAGDSNRFAAKIDASVDLASDLLARGTPSFFINGVRLTGAQPFDVFKALIDEQLAKARASVARGVPREKVYDELMKDGKGPPPPEGKAVPAPDASDPARGSANAKVVIQEFADFQCPFCKRVQPTLLALEKEYGSKIKVVWRHLPLPFHQNAPLAAEAAQEVFAQKGNAAFWAFHDKIYNSDKDGSASTDRANLERLAREAGVNMTAFDAALDTNKHQAKIAADAEIANKAGISGTPAFVINGYYLSGAQPAAAFKKLIDLALRGGPPPSITPPPATVANAPSPSVAQGNTIEASHLLVAYRGAMRAASSITRSKEEARKRAEEALAKLKNGAEFALIVAAYSDDPGTAVRGGSLGAFPRGAMIKPFEDAAFALNVNALSEVVETPFGFHVILRTK